MEREGHTEVEVSLWVAHNIIVVLHLLAACTQLRSAPAPYLQKKSTVPSLPPQLGLTSVEHCLHCLVPAVCLLSYCI